MTQYRKKHVVEASPWFKDGDHPAVIRKTDPDRYGDEGIPWCPTLEGGHIVTPGDWILTGIQGEHWPVKADIFAATYELASAAPPVQPGERELPKEMPDVCDGKEQDAFEQYLRDRKMSTQTHPVLWLFLDPKSSAAREAWKAAISYCRAAISSVTKETKK